MADIVDLSSIVRRVPDGRDDEMVDAASLVRPAQRAEPLDESTSGFTLTDLIAETADARAGMPTPDPSLDWSNQELADLYRVQALLNQAGIKVDTDRGVSDEGEPWFVFLDSQGEVFVHLCRIDGIYLLDSGVQDAPITGYCFRSLIDAFAGRASAATVAGRPDSPNVIALQRGGKIVMHPGAALAALIWTIYLANDELILAESPEAPLVADGEELRDEFAPDTSEPASPEFAALFESAEDTATFLEDAKTTREAALRATTSDARDGLQHLAATMSSPLGVTALGLSALAAAYGIEWAKPDQEATDTLEEAAALGLSETAEDETRIATVDLSTKRDGIARADQLADEDTAAADAFVPEASESEAAHTEAVADATMLTEDVAALAPADLDDLRTPRNQIDEPQANGPAVADGSGDAPIEGASDGAARDGGDAALQAIAVSDVEDLPHVLASVGMQDVLDGEYGLYSIESRAAVATENLFRLIDERMIVFGQSGAEGEATATPAPVALSSETDDAPTELAYPQARMFDDEARAFIEQMREKTDFDVIATPTEIVLIDTRAFEPGAGEAYALTWAYDDGARIAMVGIRADFEAFDMIA